MPGRSGEHPSDPFEELLERAARLTPHALQGGPWLHPGRELHAGRLLVRHRVGAGGMGVVYEAFDRERGCAVALKTLARLDATSIYRLKNEFRALSEVTHPNLVRLYELLVEHDLWLFTMELVAGKPFDEWVRPGGELDEKRLRGATVQLVAGVQAIHAAGKLHRDLKPSNVLVTDEGRLVILDFGLVSDPAPGGAGQTLVDERAAGTPAYMAPEQAAAAGASIASDFYAVGVMLYEAMTGQLPFEGPSHDILRRKQVDTAPRASTCASGLAEDLDALCAALLARDPGDRPTGPQLQELVRAKAESPTPPAWSSAPERASELIGRGLELAALRTALADAESGRPVIVRVTGESGVGKSALVGAFLDELSERERMLVLVGRCYDREAVPYKAFDRVVDELSRFLRRRSEAEVAALLPRDVGALRRLFPVLGRIEAIANAPLRSAADDQELRRRAFAAFAELLARLRDRAMLVIHIDDLQWIDHDSVLLLEHLLGQVDPAPVLLLLSYRAPDRGDPLLSRVQSAAQTSPRVELRDLELGPLRLDDATELACRRLALLPVERGLGTALALEAGRNPFLVCELSRHAASGARKGGAAVTLEQAIRLRVADLAGDSHRLLELLAVSGRPTPVEVLRRAAGTVADVQRKLDELCDVQLIRARGPRAHECYHDRVRTAVLEGLAPESARSHHERLVIAYEQSGHADLEVLFEHCRAAGQRDRAGAHAVGAADRAAKNLAFERCAGFLAHAIDLLPSGDVERLNLRERRAQALSLCGRWADAAIAFDDAANRAAEPVHRMSLLRQSAFHFLGSGQSHEGLPRLRQVLQAARIGWPRTRIGAFAGAAVRLSWLWCMGGRPHGARPVTAETRELDREQQTKLDQLMEATALVSPYDMARGLHFASVFAVLALRRPHMQQAAVATALAMLASMFAGLRIGVASSRRWAAEAIALCGSRRVPALTSSALSFVANARLVDGRWREALGLAVEAERALTDSEEGLYYQDWTARALQGLALFSLGRVGDAAKRFAENARRAREVGNDLAMIGGTSVVEHLAIDDVDGALALLERKERMLQTAGPRGVMREAVAFDRILCALYQGRGRELLVERRRRGASLVFFDSSPLLACCVLQGPPTPGARATLRKVLRRLRAHPASPDKLGVAAQLRAVQRRLDGDILGARAELVLAAEHYSAGEMMLHAALMRLREGALRRDAEGDERVAEAKRTIIALGAARPEVWADMLAPGLGVDG